MYRAVVLLIGYLLGSIQSAVLYSHMKGIEIREHGSGNAGTTNVLRVLGKKAAAIVFAGDILKAVAAVLVAKYLFRDQAILAGLYAGIGTILGHSYPLFFKLKGGKGIAVTVGAIYFIDIRVALIATGLFLICASITRIVSLSSLILTSSLPISLYFFYRGNVSASEIIMLGGIITAITAYRHKSNIKRLLNGTESKLGQK